MSSSCELCYALGLGFAAWPKSIHSSRRYLLVLFCAAIAPLKPAKNPATSALVSVEFRHFYGVAVSDDSASVSFYAKPFDVSFHDCILVYSRRDLLGLRGYSPFLIL